METDLQQMKATYQLNLEKLEYNFQVLKRRDEENTFTRSQQKRKITQLQDQLNRLRVFSKKQEESLRHENMSLSDDYKKMMEAFRDLQKKSKSLIKFEEQNFRDVWIMNEDELRKDAEKLMAADKVIMEQQLGLTWAPPDRLYEQQRTNLAGGKGKAQQFNRCTSTSIVRQQEASVKQPSGFQSITIRKSPKCRLPQTLKEAPKDVVEKFLTMLAFEPEFLIEVKMKKLLKGLPFNDQKLIRLDAVLNVLKVNSEELLDKLFTYFILPCGINRPQPLPMPPPVSPAYGQDTQMEGGKSELHECDSQSTILPESLAPTEAPAFNEEVAFSVIRLIDPIDVPQVLHRFAVENCVHDTTVVAIERAMNATTPVNANLTEVVTNEVAEKDGAAKATQRIGARQQDLLDMEMDREHWHKYLNTFAPDEKRRMWAGLKRTLQRYLTILQARSRLIVDNEALRNQNVELRHLLKLYSQSQASKNLQVEPLSTMQL
ncbi:Dynein regulatory complex protein 1 [Taenia solium]|eukprot:TsM_000872700 transcript=TsM_000872700 gene=TsM_000872700